MAATMRVHPVPSRLRGDKTTSPCDRTLGLGWWGVLGPAARTLSYAKGSGSCVSQVLPKRMEVLFDVGALVGSRTGCGSSRCAACQTSRQERLHNLGFWPFHHTFQPGIQDPTRSARRGRLEVESLTRSQGLRFIGGTLSDPAARSSFPAAGLFFSGSGTTMRLW